MKKWGMKNGEVFDTDAGGELIVNNSVEHRSDNASDGDFKGFHRIVGLDRIVTVAKSASHFSSLMRLLRRRQFSQECIQSARRVRRALNFRCPRP